MKENLRTGIQYTPPVNNQYFIVNTEIVQKVWKLNSSLAFHLAIFCILMILKVVLIRQNYSKDVVFNKGSFYSEIIIILMISTTNESQEIWKASRSELNNKLTFLTLIQDSV